MKAMRSDIAITAKQGNVTDDKVRQKVKSDTSA